VLQKHPFAGYVAVDPSVTILFVSGLGLPVITPLPGSPAFFLPLFTGVRGNIDSRKFTKQDAPG
jgi:hypothetical protein